MKKRIYAVLAGVLALLLAASSFASVNAFAEEEETGAAEYADPDEFFEALNEAISARNESLTPSEERNEEVSAPVLHFINEYETIREYEDAVFEEKDLESAVQIYFNALRSLMRMDPFVDYSEPDMSDRSWVFELSSASLYYAALDYMRENYGLVLPEEETESIEAMFAFYQPFLEELRGDSVKQEPAAVHEPENEEDLTEAVAAQIREQYEQRTFDEALDMSEHPALLNRADISGLFFEIYTAGGERYIPDVGLSDPLPSLPEDTVIKQTDAIPEEYLALMSLESIKDPVIYGLLEFTGYGNAGEYSGGLTMHYHRTRVSFYRYDTGEMVGWMTTSKQRSGSMMLRRSDYKYDGQRDVLTFSNGTIWADDVWTCALDELFYNENGYQVVGTRLLSVPEDVETIVVPDGIEEIDSMVGYNNTAKSLVLPDGLKSIGFAGFKGSALEEIRFPDSLVFAGENAFRDTPWWEAHSSEDWLIVGDGVLLYASAGGDAVTLPEEVHYVMPAALSDLSCRSLTIPDTVLQLCGNMITAPTESDSLEELIIRGGLKNVLQMQAVPVRTARYCDSLKTVVVDCEAEGLDDMWLELYSDTLSALTVYCGQDSYIAEWAGDNGVNCLPLEEYEAE